MQSFCTGSVLRLLTGFLALSSGFLTVNCIFRAASIAIIRLVVEETGQDSGWKRHSLDGRGVKPA